MATVIRNKNVRLRAGIEAIIGLIAIGAIGLRIFVVVPDKRADPDKRAVSTSRIQQLCLVLDIYARSGAEGYPDMSSPAAPRRALDWVIKNRVADGEKTAIDEDIFIDACSGEAFVPNSELSYSSLMRIDPHAKIIAFYSPYPFENKRLVGYLDKHVRWIPESDWPKHKATYSDN